MDDGEDWRMYGDSWLGMELLDDFYRDYFAGVWYFDVKESG